MKKRPYFHNDWLRTSLTDFRSVPVDEFFEDVGGWTLMSSCCCVIRATSPGGKIKEYVYKYPRAARKRVHRLLDDDHEVVIINHDTMVSIDD